MEMTLAELKKAIQESKLQPSDIFDREALAVDPAIKEHVQEKIANARGYDIRQYEKVTDQKVELEQKVKDLEAKIQAAEKEKQDLTLQAAKTKVGSLFEAQKTERSLDERQVKFIQQGLGDFTPQNPENLEKEFNAYLDESLKEYKVYAEEVFGIKTDAKLDSEKKGNGGTGPEGGKTGPVENKYVDPAQNPMIRTDVT